MLTSESQNLPPVLRMAEAAYRGWGAQSPPVGRERLAQRAGYLASCVRFGLNEPEAMRRLHGVTQDLYDVPRLDVLLPTVLDGALRLMGADFGNIQLLDPVTGSLKIVTQSGFSSEFLEYFAVVDDGHSACGRAAQSCTQAVIADVNADAGFAPHRKIAAASGFRAVVSTPLVDYACRLIGMVSTHSRRPYRPSGADLQSMELYADFAGDTVARHLGIPSGDDPGDPVSRAVISALLNPGNGQAPDVAVLAGPGDTRGDEDRPVHLSASVDETVSWFAMDTVNRLFSVGLCLDSARSIAGNGPAGDRIQAGADALDCLIRDIRTITFHVLAPGGEGGPSPADPGRWTLPPG